MLSVPDWVCVCACAAQLCFRCSEDDAVQDIHLAVSPYT